MMKDTQLNLNNKFQFKNRKTSRFFFLKKKDRIKRTESKHGGMSHSEAGVRSMSYRWFVKRCTFISTSTMCTCAPIRGTEVSVRGVVVQRVEGGGRSLNQSQVQGESGSAGP